jgi:hypothetical protein
VITREGASSRRNGIVVLDLEDPAHPDGASEFWETLTGGVHNTFIDGDLVYAVHNGTGTCTSSTSPTRATRADRPLGRAGAPRRSTCTTSG